MDSLTKNRLKLVFIAALFALPVLSAWLVYKNPQWLEGGETKNYGELVVPAIPTNFSDFVTEATEEALQPLKGRWVMLHLDIDGQCSANCEKSLHTLRQLHTLLNKDADRLQRVYLQKVESGSEQLAMNDPKLNTFYWSDAQINHLKSLITMISDGDIVLLDPLGNLMMRYKEDADPYGIQKDFKLLFKASQIG